MLKGSIFTTHLELLHYVKIPPNTVLQFQSRLRLGDLLVAVFKLSAGFGFLNYWNAVWMFVSCKLILIYLTEFKI